MTIPNFKTRDRVSVHGVRVEGPVTGTIVRVNHDRTKFRVQLDPEFVTGNEKRTLWFGASKLSKIREDDIGPAPEPFPEDDDEPTTTRFGDWYNEMDDVPF